MIKSNSTAAPIITDLMYLSSNVVEQMAKEAIVSVARGTDDMLADYPELYQSKPEIDQAFTNLREQAIELVNDLVQDMQKQLIAKLTTIDFSAKVRRIDYDDNGNVDDVEVNIEFK